MLSCWSVVMCWYMKWNIINVQERRQKASFRTHDDKRSALKNFPFFAITSIWSAHLYLKAILKRYSQAKWMTFVKERRKKASRSYSVISSRSRHKSASVNGSCSQLYESKLKFQLLALSYLQLLWQSFHFHFFLLQQAIIAIHSKANHSYTLVNDFKEKTIIL